MKQTKETTVEKTKPTFIQSLIPLIAIAVFLGIGYGVFHLNAEVLLIAAAGVAGIIALRLGYNYKEIEAGIIESMMKGMPAMLIVIVVGALIGSWIAAGTIPMLIYYGLELISPQFFLFTACVVSSVISLVTGTSYGTVGTIGVAFIGIANGLNIPLEQAAGAVVGGAYFGDKLSPFSDTTKLAPVAARSNLFDHIRHMLWTTTPAWLVGLLVYFVMGVMSQQDHMSTMERAENIQQILKAGFQFNLLLLIPLVITLYFAMRKKPVIPGMLFAPAYRKFNIAAKNLSRTTEDSGTVIVPLVPWSIAGVFMAGTLGVDTLAYAPWAIMCYTGFIFALIYGFTGFAIAPRVNEDETIPGS